MLPTQSQLCGWRYPQSLDYSISHSIGFPPGVAEANTQAFKAAATGAAETLGATAGGAGATFASAGAGASAGGAGVRPPFGPQSMHWHYRGNFPGGGWGGYRRGFGGRRFIWFGLGIGAAALYYRHKERHRLELEQYSTRSSNTTANPPPSLDEKRRDIHHNDWSWSSSWSYTPEKGWHRPDPLYQPAPVMHQPPRTQQSDRTEASAVDSAVLAALNAQLSRDPEAAAEHGVASPRVSREEDKSERRWRPWGRHHRHQHHSESAAAVPQPAPGDGTAPPDKEAEIERLRQIVADLWEQKRQEAQVQQNEMKEKAKEYARERLESLNKSLESLREALKADEGKEGKLV